MRAGVQYVHKYHNGTFDWFMRIDDDGYVIMENLIMFLRRRDPNAPEMYGVDYRTYDGYIGTGAGLSMSHRNFMERLVPSLDLDKCRKEPTHSDDVEISKCICLMSVTVGDSRDSRGRYRFFPMNPTMTLNKRQWPDWLHVWLKFDSSDVRKMPFLTVF